jgi:hypothetical protein
MAIRTDTIWAKLAERLGREPTNAEACAEVKRILSEAGDADIVKRAGQGRLAHQRRR